MFQNFFMQNADTLARCVLLRSSPCHQALTNVPCGAHRHAGRFLTGRGPTETAPSLAASGRHTHNPRPSPPSLSKGARAMSKSRTDIPQRFLPELMRSPSPYNPVAKPLLNVGLRLYST